MVIQLSYERGEQLRTWAEAQGLTITDAIGSLLKRAGATCEVPGFAVTPMTTSPGGPPIAITFAFDGFDAIMIPENILKVAEHLDKCASSTGLGRTKIRITSGQAIIGELIITRHRRHTVMLKGTMKGGETISRVLTLGVARDLAEQLRNVVADT